MNVIVRKLNSFLFYPTRYRFLTLALKTVADPPEKLPTSISRYDASHECSGETLHVIRGRTLNWKRRWRRGDRCYVACVDRTPIAYIWICLSEWRLRDADKGHPLRPRTAFLYDALTRKQWRGQGVYRNLVSACVQDLAAEGYESLCAFVSVQNPPALRALEMLGFQVTDSDVREYRLFKVLRFKHVRMAWPVGEAGPESIQPSPRSDSQTQPVMRNRRKTPSTRLKKWLRESSCFEISERLSSKWLPGWLILLGKSHLLSLHTSRVTLTDRDSKEYRRYHDYTYRRATTDDLPGLMECDGDSRHMELYSEFVSQNQVCCVLEHRGGIVGYVWVFFNRYIVTYDHYTRSKIEIHFENNTVFLGNGFIKPTYRMKGVYPLLMSEMIRDISQSYGVERFLATTFYSNKNSLVSHMRLGFEAIRTCHYIRCFGIDFFLMSSPDGGTRVCVKGRKCSANV